MQALRLNVFVFFVVSFKIKFQVLDCFVVRMAVAERNEFATPANLFAM